MITEAQRKARKNGLGGSDAAAVMGISNWKNKTPVSVFFDKTHVQESSTINPDSAFFGDRFEDVIAQYYMRRTGHKVRRKNQTVVSKQYPWMLANLDFVVTGRKILLECKTANPFDVKSWGEEGTDEVPVDYLCQVLHYMVVTGFREAHIAVLFGINDLRVYVIKYHEVNAERLIEAERRFWHEHVLKNIPPAAIVSNDCDLLNPMDNGLSVTATPEIEATAFLLLQKKRLLSALDKEVAGLELPIKTFMGASEILASQSGVKLVQWDTTTPTRLDQTRLKTDKPDLFAEYSKTQSQRSFRPNARMSDKNFIAIEASAAKFNGAAQPAPAQIAVAPPAPPTFIAPARDAAVETGATFDMDAALVSPAPTRPPVTLNRIGLPSLMF